MSLAELRAKHQKMLEEKDNQKSEGGSDFVTFDQGSNVIRFLPGKEDPFEFFSESVVHKYVDEEGKHRKYRCRKPAGEKCPVCELFWDLWKMHKELNLPKGQKSKYGDLATKIKQKSLFYAVAVSRKLQEAGENPVKIAAMGKQLFDVVMGELVNPENLADDSNGDPDEDSHMLSLDKGLDFDVIVTKNGEFNNFQTSKAKRKHTKAGSPLEVAEWMEHQIDLSKFSEVDSYEDGKKIVDNLLASLSTSKVDSVTTSKEDSDDDGEEKFNQDLKV